MINDNLGGSLKDLKHYFVGANTSYLPLTITSKNGVLGSFVEFNKHGVLYIKSQEWH